MTHITNLNAALGEVINAVASDGALIETEGRPAYAVMPLDDELLDYLLERNPAFIAECSKIRARMRQGEFRSHEEVKRLLGSAGESNAR